MIFYLYYILGFIVWISFLRPQEKGFVVLKWAGNEGSKTMSVTL